MSLQIISIILGSLTLASALMVVLSKHPIRSVIYLVVTFFFITSMYIMMNAQFLAIVNMIVYAGGYYGTLFVCVNAPQFKQRNGALEHQRCTISCLYRRGLAIFSAHYST